MSSRLPAYFLIVVLIAFEATVAWLALHPDVPPDYRAFYIDHTTTCLNQPVAGTYSLGTAIDFTSTGKDLTRPLKVCGWEGPAGDGTHAVGESSRLRFTFAEPATALTLTLRLIAIDRPEQPIQPVDLRVNGEPLGQIAVKSGEPQAFSVSIPAELGRLHPGRIELEFAYPKAITMSPGTANLYKRSIKLLSVTLAKAG